MSCWAAFRGIQFLYSLHLTNPKTTNIDTCFLQNSHGHAQYTSSRDNDRFGIDMVVSNSKPPDQADAGALTIEMKFQP